jgi:integrase/recombinase XerC
MLTAQPRARGAHATRHRPKRPAAATTPTIPARRLPPEILTAAEVLALLDACGDWPTGVRNRSLLAVLYRGGLRLNEALELRPKDVDRETGAVRVLCGKGGRARTIGLDEGALALLDRWLAVRASSGAWGDGPLGPREPLFCNRTGGKLRRAYIRRLMPQLAEKAGIAKRVHAHGLRHTHAAELRAEGVDIGIISKQLGHTSIATTVRYLDHIAPVAVVEAMRGRAWGG